MYVGKFDNVTQKKKEQLYKLIVARSDITNALRVTRLFLKRVDSMVDELYFPLQDAIVISYARPFTENKPFGSLPAKWSKFSNKEHQELHKRLITARMKHIAHSDAVVREVIIIPRGSRIEATGKREAKHGVAIRNEAFPEEYFEKIESMCLNLGGRLNREVDRMLESIFPESDTPGGQFLLIARDKEPLIL